MNPHYTKPVTPCLNLLLVITLLAGMLLPAQQVSASESGQPALSANAASLASVVPDQPEPVTNTQNSEKIPEIDDSVPPSRIPVTSSGSAPSNQTGLMFVENVGQFDPAARFQVIGANGNLWLTEDALWVTAVEHLTNTMHTLGGKADVAPEDKPRRSANLKLTFPGANPHPRLEPFNRLNTQVSYYVGNDPAKWQTNVPVWGGVRYVDFYPDVDLEIVGQNGQLVQRLVVRHNRGQAMSQSSLQQGPGARVPANPSASLYFGGDVRLHVDGVARMTSDGNDLKLATAIGDIDLPLLQVVKADGRPLDLSSVQPEINGRDITSPFAARPTASLSSPGRLSAGLASPLVLSLLQAESSDLLYSTYLGGNSSDDNPYDLTIDKTGNAYVSGYTYSTDFPLVAGNGYPDSQAFVAKLNPDGSDVLSVIMLGGSNSDIGVSVDIDETGNIYLSGDTRSDDFPTTIGAYDTTCGTDGTCNRRDATHLSSDAFVAKLNPDNTLAYATYLGGEWGELTWGSLILDQAGYVYFTGGTDSANFPTTVNALDATCGNGGSCHDAFVVKLNPAGGGQTDLLYATYLGGGDEEEGYDLALDDSNNLYITGWTKSSDFPTTSGAFDESYNGGSDDGFVVKLDPNGGQIYGTYLGSTGYDYGSSIVVDGAGNAVVAGTVTWSDFPTTPDAQSPISNGGYDAFAAELNIAGSGLIFATYLGGVITNVSITTALLVWMSWVTSTSLAPPILPTFRSLPMHMIPAITVISTKAMHLWRN